MITDSIWRNIVLTASLLVPSARSYVVSFTMSMIRVSYVGRCDHENSCGYHYTPKDYFHDNPDMKPKDWDDDTPIYNKVGTTKGKEEPKSIEPSFIPMVFVSKSLSAYKTKNPLYQYLCGVIGEYEVKRIFRLYLVGTGNKWGGCTVFWQIDANGNVRAGKLMGYDSKTGHRIKEPN